MRGYHEGMLGEVKDIYLINRSSNHFDLLVHKDSRLARKGSLKYMELHPDTKTTSEKPEETHKERET